MQAILVIVDDLIFRTKIESAAARAGVPVVVARDQSTLMNASWPLAIVDLNLSTGDPMALIQAIRHAHPSAKILAYGAHVDTELHATARAAGCTWVAPRSVFVQRLPQLLLTGTFA